MGQDQVRAALGSPTTTAAVGTGSAYYYISSTEGQTAFFKPTEKDRKVLAVYFTPVGSVDRVAQYGLKDGKVFDYVKNETPNARPRREHAEDAVPQPRHQAARPRVETPRAHPGLSPNPRSHDRRAS